MLRAACIASEPCKARTHETSGEAEALQESRARFDRTSGDA
jgi:hypothetical protein